MGAEQSTNKQTTPSTITDGQWKNQGNRVDHKQSINQSYYIYNDSLGQVKIYQNQQDLNTFIALQQTILQSEGEFSQMWQRLKRQYTMCKSVPGIIKILEINNSSEDNFCSNFYKITVVYEYFESQLSGLLKERLLSQQSFSSQEIMDFIYQLLIILNNLYKVNQNMGHGDIRPNNIYIKQYDNNEIQYILSEPGDQYQKLLLTREFVEHECNLAPELMEPLGQKVMRLKYDRTFTDIWQIGLIALNLGTFADTQTIYDWENFTIIRPQLEKIINLFTQVHGDQLGDIIKKMLELDVYERLPIATLMDQLLKLKETKKNKEESSHAQQQPESSSTSKFLVSSNKNQDQLIQSPVNNRYSLKGNHSQPVSPPQYKYSLRKVSQPSQKRDLQSNDQQNNIDCQKRNWAQEFYLNDSDTKVHVPCNPDEQFMNIHLDQLKSTYKSQFQYSIVESNENHKEQLIEKEPMNDQTNKLNLSKQNEISLDTIQKQNKNKNIQKNQNQSQSNFKRPKTGVSYLNQRGSNRITNIQKSKVHGSVSGNENQQFINSNKWQK